MHEKTNFCMNYPIGSLYGIFPYTFYHRTQLIVALNNTSPIDPVDIYHIFLDPLWVLPLSSLEVARRTETTCNFKPTNIDLNNVLRLLPGQIMSFWTSSTNTTVPFWKGCWRSFSFNLIIWDIPKHRTCWKGDMWYWGNDVVFFIQKAETKTGCLWHTHTHKHTLFWVYHRHVSIQQQSFFLHQGFLDYQLTSTTTSERTNNLPKTTITYLEPKQKKSPLLIDILPLFWRVDLHPPKFSGHLQVPTGAPVRCLGTNFQSFIPIFGHQEVETFKTAKGEREVSFFGWSSYNKPKNICSYMKNPWILSQM